jgi:hypothetical protein
MARVLHKGDGRHGGARIKESKAIVPVPFPVNLPRSLRSKRALVLRARAVRFDHRALSGSKGRAAHAMSPRPAARGVPTRVDDPMTAVSKDTRSRAMHCNQRPPKRLTARSQSSLYSYQKHPFTPTKPGPTVGARPVTLPRSVFGGAMTSARPAAALTPPAHPLDAAVAPRNRQRMWTFVLEGPSSWHNPNGVSLPCDNRVPAASLKGARPVRRSRRRSLEQ